MMTGYEHDHVVPYQSSSQSKKEQVAGMFNRISRRYDFLNRFLSGGLDIIWRKKALQQLKGLEMSKMLDVATGTADVAIMASGMYPQCNITGIDISEGMLDFGRKKLAQKKLENRITLMTADSERLPFEKNSFDAVTVAFGVRNFQDLEKGIQEIFRVLRLDGKLVVLEFSKPTNLFIKIPYFIYMKFLTPLIGGLFSKDKAAYAYLDKSIQKFPEGSAFLEVLKKSGFSSTIQKKRSFGICSIYCAVK